MCEKTFIKGKDAALETSIATMQEKLSVRGFEIEEVGALNPVTNCYSVHLRDRTCARMFSNGKGATSKSSLASALGEFVERLSCNLFFADYYLGEANANAAFVHYPHEKWFVPTDDIMPEGLMDNALFACFDPLKELTVGHLYDLNSGNGERGICALPYVRNRDGQTVYIPVGVIENLFVSNGMAAGNSKDEARVQALCEILERHVKNRIISEQICLPEVPSAVIDRYPLIADTVQALQNHGFHLRVADASLGGKYPVMSVTLINPKEGSVFASFGAHPCFEVALERTITELLQGRRIDQLAQFESPIFDAGEIASQENLESHFVNSTGLLSFDFFKDTPDYPFVSWDFVGDTAQEYAHLVSIFEEDGAQIYIADFEHLDVYACRVLVPGLSNIYPVEDLVWNNSNEGAKYRESFLSMKSGSKVTWTQLLDDLEDGGYNDAQEAAQFIHVIPDKGTLWETLHIGEVKAMLALALRSDDALRLVNWCLQFNSDVNEKTLQYRCIRTLLEIQDDPERIYETYHASLVLLYGAPLLTVCRGIVAGTVVFHNLHCPGLGLDGFEAHGQLLKEYAIAQGCKIGRYASLG